MKKSNYKKINTHGITRNIEAICPNVFTWIEVRDNWYPSYQIHNKLWVTALIQVIPNYYDSEKYGIQLIFWGEDNFALEKWIKADNFSEAVNAYKFFKHLLKKIKKMNTLRLKDFLYRNGFEPW